MKGSIPNPVNLVKLASSAVTSSIIASMPIKRIALSSSFPMETSVKVPLSKNTRLKKDGTFVTDADGAAQRIIVENLRRISRDIRIVGEESKENEITIQGDETFDQAVYDEVLEEIHTRIRDKKFEIPKEIDPARVTVFIDPLDGTNNYANGKYDSVTTLIAIIIDNLPTFGVICKPFGRNTDNYPSLKNSKCFVVYGGTLLHGVYIAGGGECRPNKTCQSNYKAIISKSRSAGVVEECVRKLHSRGLIDKEPLYISGAGEKTLRLILAENNESLWFFPKPGTCAWDVAAADALLSAAGGKLTDKYGNPIDYSRSRSDAGNKDGVVASNSIKLHQQCIQIFNEGEWGQDP